MQIEVYDIKEEGKLKEFVRKYHPSSVENQIRILSGRRPYFTIHSLFEKESKTRYILWSKGEVSAVVEEYHFNNTMFRGRGSNGSGEKSVCKLVFNYASNPSQREDVFSKILELTDANLVIGLDPDDKKSTVFYSGREYVKSKAVWKPKDIKGESMRTKYSLVECLTKDRPVLTTQSFHDRENTKQTNPLQQPNFYDMAVTKAAFQKKLFYPI
jgi:hypothetical protein